MYRALHYICENIFYRSLKNLDTITMCGNIVMSVMCAHNGKHKRVEIETRSQSSFLSQFEIQDQQLH